MTRLNWEKESKRQLMARHGSEYINDMSEKIEKKVTNKNTKKAIAKKYKCRICGNIFTENRLSNHAKLHKGGFTAIKVVITRRSHKQPLAGNKISTPQTVTLSKLTQELSPFFHKYIIKLANTMQIKIKKADDLILASDAARIRNYMRKLYG